MRCSRSSRYVESHMIEGGLVDDAGNSISSTTSTPTDVGPLLLHAADEVMSSSSTTYSTAPRSTS